MCSKIGKLLTIRCSKWTNKLPVYGAYITCRSFAVRPANMCEINIQTAGLHIVTPRILNVIGDYERKQRRYNTATYGNVRDAGNANNVWIIDVRDPKEIKRTGVIHNAINIPLKDLEAAFQFTPQYFFNRYGVSKPYIDSSIIFCCRSGRLSKVAYELAESMGFKNLKNFDGGYMLYEKLCDFDVCVRTTPTSYPPVKVDTATMATIATFEDVQNIKQNEYLIDVRNPDELEETGTLPHSINIPLDNLAATIALEDDAFVAKFNRPKPSSEDKIIFSCRSGARAEKAALQMIEMGFTNVAYYKGSWTEWVSKDGKVCKVGTERDGD